MLEEGAPLPLPPTGEPALTLWRHLLDAGPYAEGGMGRAGLSWADLRAWQHGAAQPLARIAHSPSELVLDFARMLPGASAPQMTTRLVMSPLGAKLFLRALAENVARFEAAFGEIAVPGDPTLADGLFHGPGQEPPKP